MIFEPLGAGAYTYVNDLCDWEVSFRVLEGSAVEHTKAIRVTGSARDAWDLARGKLESIGCVVGLPVAIKLLGRWI